MGQLQVFEHDNQDGHSHEIDWAYLDQDLKKDNNTGIPNDWVSSLSIIGPAEAGGYVQMFNDPGGDPTKGDWATIKIITSIPDNVTASIPSVNQSNTYGNLSVEYQRVKGDGLAGKVSNIQIRTS